jgi:anti-sigma factor RsiW
VTIGRLVDDDRPPDELTCLRVVELLDDHLDGALSVEERAAVEAHLVGCADCRAYLAQLRAAVTVSVRLRAHDVPPPLLDVLLDVYRGRL